MDSCLLIVQHVIDDLVALVPDLSKLAQCPNSPKSELRPQQSRVRQLSCGGVARGSAPDVEIVAKYPNTIATVTRGTEESSR